jgi:Uma2 family endonuclease
MNALHEKILDFDELMEFEANSPVRHEYIGGRLYAMAGGTAKHAHLGVNLSTAVHSRLRGKPCRGASPDQRVRFDNTQNWFYPDFLIMCPPFRFHPRDKDALMNPRAIFEVLSPKTESFDRTTKFDQYVTNPELSDYILVSSDELRVEHYRRSENGDWVWRAHTGREATLQLGNFDIAVPLSEIYEDIELEEHPTLPFEEEL